MQPSPRTYKGATPLQRAEHRRTQLIDAAVDVFGTVGYRAATIDQICARAGLSKRYFYESFHDSEALLLACFQRCSDQIHEAMLQAVASAADDLDQQLRATLAGYFGAMDEDPRRARITLLEIHGISINADAAYAAQTARFATTVEGLAAETFNASDLPKSQLHVVAQGIIGAVSTVAIQWLLEHRTRPCTELVDATHVLVLAVFDRLRQT